MTLPSSLRPPLIPLIFFLSTVLLSAATEYQVGDPFEPIFVKDQHERDAEVSAANGIRHFIVSFTMGSGKKANQYLEKKGSTWLEDNQAAFLANIYGMPAVGRFFALPKMQKYPHRILLGDNENLLDRYPMQDGKLTVLDLDRDGIITAIRFLDPGKDLDSLLP